MGCDIHAYIEYDTKFWRGGEEVIWTSQLAHFYVDRNYGLFGVLANVRCEGAPFPPRGFPERHSWSLLNDFAYFISEESEENAEASCTPARAAQLEKMGYQRVSERRIQCPDNHTPSWLTLEELEQVKTAYEALYHRDFPRDMQALMATMRVFAEGNRDVDGLRLVFWFDN